MGGWVGERAEPDARDGDACGGQLIRVLLRAIGRFCLGPLFSSASVCWWRRRRSRWLVAVDLL